MSFHRRKKMIQFQINVKSKKQAFIGLNFNCGGLSGV